MKRIISLIVVVIMLTFVGGAIGGTSKLSVSPSSPVVGDNMIFSGCGYTPGDYLQVQAVFNSKSATVIDQIGETVDVNGCFSTSDFPVVASNAGKWTTNVFSYATGHKLATLNFIVS